MSTPISPDHQPDRAGDQLAPTIDAIVGGDFARSHLAVLSDLDRVRTAYLRTRWADIPRIERHALILALAELAAESVEFNFNRVFRIALTDADPVIRELAIRDLWEDQGSDLPHVFIDLVRDDPSDDVRAAAADALSSVADAAAAGDATTLEPDWLIEQFTSLVKNPGESPIVRRRALGTIAAFGNDPRVPALIRFALADEDQTLVAGAIYAMGRTAKSVWVPELAEFIESEDAELRFEAARAAGAIGDEDLVPNLAELIYDRDVEVRTAALDALGEIGGQAAIRVLRVAEENTEFEDQEIVDDALDAALLTIDPLEGRS